MQIAQPDVRSALEVIAAELVAVGIALIHAWILGVGVLHRYVVAASTGTRSVQNHGVGQQVASHVGLEHAEDVPILLQVEDLVAERAEQGRAQVPGSPAQPEIQSGREIGMGTPDDRAVGRGDMVVPIHIDELDAAGTGAVVPAFPHRVPGAALRGVQRIPIVAIRDQAIERPDRIAHLVDDGILFAGDYRTKEIRRRSIEFLDLVDIMAAVERHVPELALAQVAGIADGKLDAFVVHLTDIDEGGGCEARGTRKSGGKQQIVRFPVVHVNAERALAVEESEIQSDVYRLVLFPLQVRIAQCRLPEAGQHRGARSTDIVEGVSHSPAKLVGDATRRDVLIAGDAPPEAEHGVRDEVAAREEGFLRQAPPRADGGEGTPPVRRGHPRGAVASEGEAQKVAVGKIVVELAEERQQRADVTPAVHVLCLGVAQGIGDIPVVQARVEQVGEGAVDPPGRVAVRLLSDQYGDVVSVERGHVIERVAPGPLHE